MTRPVVALWMTLVGAIVAISVLALLWIRQREQNTRQRVHDVLITQLIPINESVSTVMNDYSLRLQKEVGVRDIGNLQDCVQMTRSPLAHAFVVVDQDSRLHFPTNISRESTDRQSLIDEARQLLNEQGDPRPNPTVRVPNEIESDNQRIQPPGKPGLRSRSYQGLDNLSQAAKNVVQKSEADEPHSDELERSDPTLGKENFGWITWYHRRNMILGFWWHQGERWRSIVVLPSARWMADIVAELPNTRQQKKLGSSISSTIKKMGTGGSVKQLVDVEGNVVYQWGSAPTDQWEAIQAGQVTAELPVTNPLEGWRLRVYASESLARQLAGDDLVAPIWLAVGAIATALVLGGLIVTINLNRQLRLAASRVSFVNQVSHELRTPLTNICMYADLLANQIEMHDAEPKQLERIGVIQDESRRLGRLIGNVLEFASSDSKAKPLKMSACVLDDLVRDVLATFRPRLDQLGFQVVVELQLPKPRQMDADAVEQILVNLIGNAQKYAAEGKRLEIATSGTSTHAELLVRDSGPGVPARLAQKIFAPFERLSNRLEDPAGTGIGLSIARELARRHGGDCTLIDSSHGAAFRCVLAAPLIDQEE